MFTLPKILIFRRSIRSKLALLLLAAGLLPASTAAWFAWYAVNDLATLAGEQALAAVRAEARLRLQSSVEQAARRNDQLFERARADAVAVARFLAFLYENPNLLQPYLGGGTPLRRLPAGHWANDPETPIGVFVPRTVTMGPHLWQEVGLTSHIDPLLMALSGRTPHVDRIWIITQSGIVRAAPNPRLGHPGSPVGAATDLRRSMTFTLAAPERNPAREAIWTPPYDDPGGRGRIVSAIEPVYLRDGRFVGVTGVDVLIDEMLPSLLGFEPAGAVAFLIDANGRLIGSSAGQERLLESLLPQLPEIAAAPSGSTEIAEPPVWLTMATMNSTGWTLAIAVPAAQLADPAAATLATIAQRRAYLLAGWAAGGLVLALLLVLTATAIARRVTRPLQQLTETARKAATGTFPAPPPVVGRAEMHDEIGVLTQTFARMMVELRDLHEHLEQQARERAARLLEQERRLAVLAERNRLAGEIHDTLAQGFTGILMQLRAARQVMAEDPAAADLHLARAAELARKSLDEARRSVWDLWSQGERREDLSTVLARVAERLQSAGLKVQLQLPVAPTNPTDRPLIDAHAAIHVARIAEEAAANIVDHAQARRVTIRLERLKAAGATLLALEITDDGCGFDPAYPPVEPPRGFGLISMRHRAEQIGGQLTIDSAPGRGTRLRLVVPERGGP